MQIMRDNIGEIAEAVGEECVLIEYGSGSSLKVRLLLDHLKNPHSYIPIDVCGEHLEKAAAELRTAYPQVAIVPMEADFTQVDEVGCFGAANPVIYFPGSTIGNFKPDEAVVLLQNMRKSAGTVLIGVDLHKDWKVLEAAYNDKEGVTAAFNKNMLTVINRHCKANFRLDQFRHWAVYNEYFKRIEMHLIASVDQWVTIAGERVFIEAEKSVVTEYSHKYTLEGFAALAARAGYRVERVWTDPKQYFSVQLLKATDVHQS